MTVASYIKAYGTHTTSIIMRDLAQRFLEGQEREAVELLADRLHMALEDFAGGHVEVEK